MKQYFENITSVTMCDHCLNLLQFVSKETSDTSKTNIPAMTVWILAIFVKICWVALVHHPQKSFRKFKLILKGKKKFCTEESFSAEDSVALINRIVSVLTKHFPFVMHNTKNITEWFLRSTLSSMKGGKGERSTALAYTTIEYRAKWHRQPLL